MNLEMTQDPTCSDCGNLVTNNVCGCGFAVMKMSELTKELQERGIKARFEMSGGNCGTIYLGEVNAEGFAEFAVGCGNYSLDEIYLDDTCWGVDGQESATYYTGTPADFTPAKVADLIATDYEKVRK